MIQMHKKCTKLNIKNTIKTYFIKTKSGHKCLRILSIKIKQQNSSIVKIASKIKQNRKNLGQDNLVGEGVGIMTIPLPVVKLEKERLFNAKKTRDGQRVV